MFIDGHIDAGGLPGDKIVMMSQPRGFGDTLIAEKSDTKNAGFLVSLQQVQGLTGE
jgi:hypothetical protein